MGAATAILATTAVVGAGAKIIGNAKANAAQRQAELANAAFYTEQAQFAEQATERSLKIFYDESMELRSRQRSQGARGGATGGGSALLLLADTVARQYEEQEAIKEDGRMKAREAYLKAGASMDQAERLSGFAANGLPAIGTIITAAADVGTRIRG